MKKILIVEDDKHLGQILKDQLEHHGYEISILRLPKQTVDVLLMNSQDLVILDKLLGGGVDGIDICKEIRNTELISQTPILMMSGFDESKDFCIESGADNFISKPFGLDELKESIEKTINIANHLE